MTVAHALPFLVQGVWAVNQVTELGTIAKLLLARQFSGFKSFAIYLIADVTRSFILWWYSSASVSSSLYAHLWLRSEPLLLALQGVAVIEFYARLYQGYPGIGRFAKILTSAAALAAISLCLVTVGMDLREQWKHPDLQMMMFAKRLLSSVAAALLALTLLFFPKARSARPTFEIGWLLTALLGAAAIGYFAIDVMAPIKNNSVEIGTIVIAVQSITLLCWTLKPLPKPMPSTARHTADDEWVQILRFARWFKHKNELE